RLADAQIPAVLLVGNHDQHTQGQGGASLCIYRTLGVPGFVVGDRLATHRITTANGPVQVITLPWLTHSTLLTKQDMQGRSLAEVGQALVERLRLALEGEIQQLDPEVPTVLIAHAMLDPARLGAERFLAVGKGFSLPLSLVARDCFDYVALGHVHKHQILCEQPPVVYPGSIERVDFSEEAEAKGYVLVNLERQQTTVEFCPLPVRAFQTVRLDLTDVAEPQQVLRDRLRAPELHGAVVRLLYQLRTEQVDRVDESALHAALQVAHSYTIQPELVAQTVRSRLPELGEGQNLHPLAALRCYLDSRKDLSFMAKDLIAAAETLMDDTLGNAEALESLAPSDRATVPYTTNDAQLPLW
ncbi:MAG: exonuclease SbcCD subunit D, partial [Cyanobacteria bacterium P01_H01_bin.121]